MRELQGTFRPEFLNRIDEIIFFEPLGEAQLGQIVAIQVERFDKLLAERQITLHLSDAGSRARRRGWLRSDLRCTSTQARPAEARDRSARDAPLAGEFRPGDHIEADVDGRRHRVPQDRRRELPRSHAAADRFRSERRLLQGARRRREGDRRRDQEGVSQAREGESPGLDRRRQGEGVALQGRSRTRTTCSATRRSETLYDQIRARRRHAVRRHRAVAASTRTRSGAGGPGVFDLGDLFGQFFSSGGTAPRRARARGARRRMTPTRAQRRRRRDAELEQQGEGVATARWLARRRRRRPLGRPDRRSTARSSAPSRPSPPSTARPR